MVDAHKAMSAKELQTYVKRNSSVRSQSGIVNSFVDLKLQLNSIVPGAKLITENVGRSVDVVTYDVASLSSEQRSTLSKVMKASGWAPVISSSATS